MGSTSVYLSILLQIVLLVNSARSDDDLDKLDLDSVKTIYTLNQNFNVSNIVSEISHIRSMENDDCFKELSAITNGLENLDEWAIKSE